MASPNRDLVDRLRHYLATKGLDDAQVENGAGLSPAGLRGAATVLGVAPHDMGLLMQALVQRIRDERKRYDVMVEDYLSDGAGRPRFTTEPDALGNVTVRDAETGKSVFLSGTKATALANRLKGSSPEQQQAILATFATTMEAEDKFRPRAMTSDDEDEEHERPHAVALRQTGFWGKQGAGCIVIARRTGRVLLAHRSDQVLEPHTWGNWGGAVDEGVTPEDHALQELYEETGYHGRVLARVPLFVFEKGSFRYSNFMFVVPDEFKPHLNWESQGYRWCEFGQWPSPLHYGLAALFNDPASVTKIKAVCSAAIDPAVHESLDEEDEHLDPEDHEIEPAILDEEEDFDAEIAQTGGLYNFPWATGGRHGTGTARYSVKNGETHVIVVSTRDDQGQEIDTAGRIATAIEQQAIDFIGHE